MTKQSTPVTNSVSSTNASSSSSIAVDVSKCDSATTPADKQLVWMMFKLRWISK